MTTRQTNTSNEEVYLRFRFPTYCYINSLSSIDQKFVHFRGYDRRAIKFQYPHMVAINSKVESSHTRTCNHFHSCDLQ